MSRDKKVKLDLTDFIIVDKDDNGKRTLYYIESPNNNEVFGITVSVPCGWSLEDVPWFGPTS